jgi:hypothetical protein
VVLESPQALASIDSSFIAGMPRQLPCAILMNETRHRSSNADAPFPHPPLAAPRTGCGRFFADSFIDGVTGYSPGGQQRRATATDGPCCNTPSS